MTTASFKHLCAASAHFHALARAKLAADDGRTHAPTLILGAARVAGMLMFRSFRVDTGRRQPGMRIASDEALIFGARMRDVLLATLRQLGHAVDAHDLDNRHVSQALSRLSFIEIHERLTPACLSYHERSALGARDAAMAAVMAIGGLIHDSASVIEPHEAAALAAIGFDEGLTTVPFPLAAPRPGVEVPHPATLGVSAPMARKPVPTSVDRDRTAAKPADARRPAAPRAEAPSMDSNETTAPASHAEDGRPLH